MKCTCMMVFCAIAAAVMVLPVTAQDQEGNGPTPVELRVKPESLTLEVGDKADIVATVLDADGIELEIPVVYLSMSRRSVGVNQAGNVAAIKPGEFVIMALVPRDREATGRRAMRDAALQVLIPVTIPNPPITSIETVETPTRFYAGTSVRLENRVIDASGALRRDVKLGFTSSDRSVAEIDAFGYLKLRGTGKTTITISAEEARAQVPVSVSANPTVSLDFSASFSEARSGDVIHFAATASDADGNTLTDVPVQYALHARTVEHGLGEPPSGLIQQDGRFVADLPGEYTIVAVSGSHSAMHTVNIVPRNVKREIEFVGQGPVRDRATSDLWIWEGADGRDYAITGTWGAAGHAYIWDVTDPSNMVMIDALRVDARTVNDVKVSEDGTIAVISREGASNRRNGLVVLDVSNLQDQGARVLARYDDQLTGGVHNVFVADNHIYALSAGRRYDIINIEDPSNPHRVGRFEMDTPGHSIHDVWVVDGIAYSSNWGDGVVAVDVGGGDKGGSPRNPVYLGKYAYPSGWNHAAFPYYSKSAGKFYMFAGDEAGRRGGTPEREGEPPRMNGWIHVIEWDDWDNPKEVARYEVPEAGSHNLWVEDDILYVAYYQGGLRLVDVSGELMGDLYRQDREIGYWMSYDPEGFVPNAPFAWGPQPHKGTIFFSDHNSGLWAVRLKPLPGETEDNNEN